MFINANNSLGTVSSSIVYKENIKSVPDQIPLINSLEVKSFNYINDETKETNYGLIAEQVYDIYPTLIVEKKDENGNILIENDKPVCETVRYHFLPPLLIKCVQELSAENTTLKNTITNLQARILAIETSLNL